MEVLPETLEGWTALVAVVIAAASAIAAVTPTPRDDRVIGKLYRVVDLLALNVGRAKDRPPVPSSRHPGGDQPPRPGAWPPQR